MKLIALYSVFDGEEHLEGSIAQVRPHVDFVLCAVQTVSYWGEQYEGGAAMAQALKRRGLVDAVANYTPDPNLSSNLNELRKRSGAMELGQKAGFTHFLHIDCDEYYVPAQFAAAKGFLAGEDVDGSVARIKTYFKRPDWELEGLEAFYVPFIHRYRPGLTSPGSDYPYPFKCDPTRLVNTTNVALLPSDMILMHHYSWVRKDIERKLRNSTLAHDFPNTGILHDYQQAALGSYIFLFQRRVRQGSNPFNVAVGT